MNKDLGAVLTITAGVMWGFGGTCGQFIFERFPIDPSHLTTIRMLAAGLILAVAGLITDRRNMIGIWQSRQACGKLLLYGLLGIMFSQLTYMQAISYTNSGTATILQYTGPVLVMVISCFMQKRLPTPREALAIVLVILGTFFIATHGSLSNLIINTQGLAWGLAAAVALALYTLIPGRITQQYGSITVTAYGMLIGGIVLFVISRAWEMQLSADYRFVLAFLGLVVLGTALTFSIYLKGLSLIGPVKASMLASVEPVSAAVFMIVWLGVPFHYMDLLGFVCILATVFLLTRRDNDSL